MSSEPTADEIRELNERGRLVVDELFGVLEPAAGPNATLSALQLVIGRSPLGPAELLQAMANLIGHNFQGQARVVLVAPTGEGECEDDEPTTLQ